MSYFYQYVKFKSSSTIEFQDGSTATEFILSTQQADLGYGAADRKIFTKDLSIGDIRYTLSSSGLQQIQNTSISFSNVGQFYHILREINGDDFWNTLEVSIYWATGRIPSLVYDGTNWREDGETIVTFTPTITYPLLNDDYIKKEFEGSLSNATISKDKISLSLVSKSKQTSYLVGEIQSFNGADSSRALISPIILGDLTDENAYVPLILKNPVSSKSVGICSDTPLVDAPTPFIYDDENERFHEVINDQSASNQNKQIEFYNQGDFEAFNYDNDYVSQSKTDATTNGPIYHTLTTGEVVGYFTDSKDYVIFSSYSTPLNYYITDTVDRLRDEGTRDFNNDGGYIDGLSIGYLLDQDMTIGIAKINLSLYPINLKEVTAVGTDIDNPIGANLPGFLEYTQDPGGPDDFEPIDAYNELENGAIGAFKEIVNYKEDQPRAIRTEPNYTDAGESVWFAAHARGANDPLATEWPYYNYNNKLRIGVSADFDQFKFDSDILDLTFRTFGGVYKNFESSSSSEAFDISGAGFDPKRSLVTINYDAGTGGTGEKIIHDEDSIVGTQYQIDDTYSALPFAKLSDFYDSPPTITFNGYTTYQPVKSTTPSTYPPLASSCYLDVASPSFFGASRFALDGFRVDAQVKASVESKYWCFKGKTNTNETLLDGLNVLSTRYETPAFTSGDAFRDDWILAGAHVGNPIYFRDILSKIADEFRVIITDRNGILNIVALGSSANPAYTINESNTFTPYKDNIKLKETKATEIYNKIVIRYAKNHMTKRYGKTIALTSTDVQRTFGITIFDVSEAQGYLQTASDTLTKIGITEKTKAIDLDWVRDDYTANEILKWWCANSRRQRAKVTVDVSKVDFIDAQIGDVVDLDLPSTPEFYQVNYQIMQINNKSSKRYSLELEEFKTPTQAGEGLQLLSGDTIDLLDGESIDLL